MRQRPTILRTALLSSAAAAAALTGAEAAAQSESDVIVVTGSHIRGTPEDAALPVDVISEQELLNQGSPTTLDLIKNLSVSSGVLGDTNQFDSRAQGSEGSGTVNLRGLGPQRTLVLLNGRRMVMNPFALAGAGAVDTNTIPSAAIGRVEVLKDGAAATYGSDAIGGVVNFITRGDFEGIEIGGNYSSIEGSEGNYDVHGVWGWSGDQASLVLSVGMQHRSELPVLERDWAHLPYMSNPQGGWSAAGSPNTYIPLGATTTAFRDAGCATLGGTPGFTGAAPVIVPVCYWQYSVFDNLIEEETRYQVFADFNVDLTDTTEFHLDTLYARTEVPEWHTSPSYALLQSPQNSALCPATTCAAAPIAGRFLVPGAAHAALYGVNPGLTDYLASNPGNIPAFVIATGAPVPGGIPAAAAGAGVLYTAGRPFALGGNPLFNFGAATAEREYTAFRISGGLSGSFGDAFDWDFNLTYGEEEARRTGRDTVVNRFQRALVGRGGPNCPITGPSGVGPCMYFNPFASSIPANAINGAGEGRPGPYEYNPALGGNENLALIDWFFPDMVTTDTAGLATAELVLSGVTPITLAGGDVAWAFGGQLRHETFERELSDLQNIDINPCINSVDLNDHSCAVRTGALGFLGSSSEQNLSNDIFAVFGELNVPLTDAIEIQLAARYEDYGGETGSTFDPKIAARWQLSEFFALRASAGSTFRGPALTSTTNGSITSLQNVLETFRAIDIFGNPALEPESANTYNVGAILDTGNLFVTVDYWRFDFENPIISEPLAGMVAAMFPNGNALPNNCGNPAYAGLQARFTFSIAGCGPANVVRVRTNYVNGSPIENSGVDFQARYDIDDVMGGTLSAGIGGTYVIGYEVDTVTVEGIAVQQAFDAVGLLNYQTSVYPIPQWRGNAFVEWGSEMQNLRLSMNYVDGYTDQRVEPFVASVATNGVAIAAGKQIDSYVTFDLNYRLDLPWNATISAGVMNLTDEDPPFARLDLNYDPFVGDPTGRVFRVGVRQRFN